MAHSQSEKLFSSALLLLQQHQRAEASSMGSIVCPGGRLPLMGGVGIVS